MLVWWRSGDTTARLVALSILVYIPFLIVSFTFFDAEATFRPRLLLPATTSATILAIYGVQRFHRLKLIPPCNTRTLATATVLLLPLYFWQASTWLLGFRDQGGRFSTAAWRGSEVIARIRAMGPDVPLASNQTPVLYLLANRGGRGIPAKHNAYSLRANDRYWDQVRFLRRELVKGDGRVAYFYPPRKFDPPEAELARDMSLHLLIRDGVGALYSLDLAGDGGRGRSPQGLDLPPRHRVRGELDERWRLVSAAPSAAHSTSLPTTLSSWQAALSANDSAQSSTMSPRNTVARSTNKAVKTVQIGLDMLVADRFRSLRGRRIGLLVNPASVDAQLVHAVDRFRGAAPEVELVRLFGPQHGLWGQTQDNMVEWSGFVDPHTGVEVVSLYGEHRKPTPDDLRGLDALVIDLPDVGARYYTFLWTATLCLQACRAAGVEVIVLDRPNPLGGQFIEGPGIDEGYESFVGLHSLPLRHGFTIGEALRWIAERIGAPVRVIKMRGWDARPWFDRTGQPWVMPSPNMPTLETAVVYPGMCLLEGTELSEGRGTTRPFELFGAPWLDPHRLVADLRKAQLPGVFFRPCHFEPTFQKHAGKVCGGAQLHVVDRARFFPARTAVAVLIAARAQTEGQLWRDPPYEYEEEKPPIDILSGSGELREAIDAGADLATCVEPWDPWEEAWRMERLEYLLYAPRERD